MGRRRRKLVKVIRRRLPEFYLCPKCGKNTVRANINRKQERVWVACGSCALKRIYEISPQMEEVDAYCLFIDSYYGADVVEEVKDE